MTENIIPLALLLGVCLLAIGALLGHAHTLQKQLDDAIEGWQEAVDGWKSANKALRDGTETLQSIQKMIRGVDADD